MRSFSGVCVAALMAVVHTAAAQSVPPLVRLRLVVVEENPDRVERAFASALGRIPDVKIVASDDEADLRLSVLAICVPRGAGCRNAMTYAVSVTFEEPLPVVDLFDALRMGNDSLPAARRASTGDQMRLAEVMRPPLAIYRRVLRRYAASWGRTVVEQAIAETIAEFDAKCLEKRRIEGRAQRARNEGDIAAAHTLRRRLDDQPERWWSC